MQSRVLQRLAVAAVLVFGAGASVVATAAARPVLPGPRARSAFNLFGGSVNLALVGNRVACNLTNFGNICVNPYGSGTIEGGFWPAGSPDAYVFNTGLQIAATIPSNAGFTWANDTVGVFFMDPRGPQRMGEGITNVYNGLSASDLAAWPPAAYVTDRSLYNPALLGQKTISQQDTWVRYWDGNPQVGTGRKHTMGVLVEQRGLLWNTAGKEDLLFFLFRFINITATDPTAYAGLANPDSGGYSAAEIADIVSIAQRFHDNVLATYGVNIPAGGYTFHNTFAAIFQDPDLGFANDHNYSQAVLPFDITAVTKSNYSEPQWVYPSYLFGAPFTAAPGFEGVRYLKSPTNPATGRPFGISVWGNSINAAGGMPDAVGIWQMYRYLSGTNSTVAGDTPCNAKEPPAISHTCSSWQSFADTRFYMSSGPFDLGPGQSSVIAVALVFAAPVAAQTATTNGIYSMSAFSLTPFIDGTKDYTYLPGWPAQPESLAVFGSKAPDNTPYVRDPIERAMGWGQYGDYNSDGRINGDSEVATVPGSLLDKAKTAKLVFDLHFLSPFAPAAPDFYLVPGDGQVSVLWKKSTTETDGIGDPYFAVTSDPTSAFYDPNYRQFDVEGYRIYRGRTKANLELLAQFDYAGTSMVDYTGNVYDPTNYGDANAGAYQCAPELGITASCPSFPFAEPLVGNVIQIRTGGRQALANGSVVITKADTAVTGSGSPFPALRDNNVPFAYVDNTVRNGFTYYYAVSAFDVNSYVSSVSSSLESSIVTKAVTPHAQNGQETAGSLGTLQLLGGDGTVLDPTAALPTIDPATGIFSGPMPPTNGGGLGFMAFVAQVLAPGNGALTLTVDSVLGGDAWDGVNGIYYVSVGSRHLQISFPYSLTTGVDTVIYPFPAQFNNQAKGARFGGDSTFALYGSFTVAHDGVWLSGGWGRGSANGVGGFYNGPRWWAGSANETTPNPNGGMANPTTNAGGVPGSVNRTAGSLPGVDSLFFPLAYSSVLTTSPMRYLEGHTAAVHRAADFSVYWGASTATTGIIDSVVDVTHHTKVPFKTTIDASWGILNDSSFLGIVDSTQTRDKRNSILTWSDIFCVAPWPAIGGAGFGGSNACGGGVTNPAPLMNHARLSPIAARGGSYAGTTTVAATGTGFIFYLNGHFFLMQMTGGAFPASGTVWHMRDYVGSVSGDSATASFSFKGGTRPITVPGLQFKISYQGSVVSKGTVDSTFKNIHTVPDPYYVTNSLELSPNNKILLFVNLPSQCIVRIYSASGILIRVLTKNDAGNGSELQWDLRNRNNQFVASGVYFYHVEAADGRTKIGRFTVVNFAQ
jgi:hypothetical protein